MVEATELEKSKYISNNSYGINSEYVNNETFIEWKLKARSLIVKIAGKGSEYYIDFNEYESSPYDTNYESLKKLRSILLAFKKDYEDGFLDKVKDLVEADIFDDELEQAEELLSKNYYIPSAVIAGTVLETFIKKLCESHNIETGSLNYMNQSLTKNGIISKLHQKQITALADIRNNAAHGNTSKFNENDINKMIRDIRDIISNKELI